MSKLYLKFLTLIILVLLILTSFDQILDHNSLISHVDSEIFDKDKNVDFIFFGNSLSQHSFNDKMIDSAFNSSSYSLGSPAQYFPITAELYKKSIKSEIEKPLKLTVVVVSPYQFEVIDTEKWRYLQKAALDHIPKNENYFKIINRLYDYKEYPETFFKSIRFHNEFSTKIKESSDEARTLSDSDARGFINYSEHKLAYNERVKLKNFSEKISNFREIVERTESMQLNPIVENALFDIITLSKNRKIPLLLITPPAPNLIDPIKNYGHFKYLDSISKKHKVNYVNLNESYSKLNLTLDDFSDPSHLNKYGNKKVTQYLIEYMKDTLGIKTNEKQVKNIKPVKTKKIYQGHLKEIARVRSEIQPSEVLSDSTKSYLLKRTSITESSLIMTIPISGISKGSRYRAIIKAKKGLTDSQLALRIQGKYPNRVDAVFNLDEKRNSGLALGGEFSNPKAQIKDLKDGYFECSVEVDVSDSELRIIIGSTDNITKSGIWEAATPFKTDIIVVPESIQLLELSE